VLRGALVAAATLLRLLQTQFGVAGERHLGQVPLLPLSALPPPPPTALQAASLCDLPNGLNPHVATAALGLSGGLLRHQRKSVATCALLRASFGPAWPVKLLRHAVSRTPSQSRNHRPQLLLLLLQMQMQMQRMLLLLLRC
jgi:hypothetical protein